MKYSAYCSITFSPLHFMLYRGKMITFGTVWALPEKATTVSQFFLVFTKIFDYKVCVCAILAPFFNFQNIAPGCVNKLKYLLWAFRIFHRCPCSHCLVCLVNDLPDTVSALSTTIRTNNIWKYKTKFLVPFLISSLFFKIKIFYWVSTTMSTPCLHSHGNYTLF